MYPRYVTHPTAPPDEGIPDRIDFFAPLQGQPIPQTRSRGAAKIIRAIYEVEFATHTIRVWNRTMPLKAMERQLYNMECIFSGSRENSHLLYTNEAVEPTQLQGIERDLGFQFNPKDNPFLTEISTDHPIYSRDQQIHLINRATEISYIANKRRYLNPLKSPSPYSQLPPLNNEQYLKSNSTSSLWTTAQPALGLNDVLSGTAELIFTHISHRLHHDLAMMSSEQVAFAFEESTYTGKPSEPVTEPKHVEAFMRHAFELAKFQPETCIVTLIFLNRFLNRTNIPLHAGNWKPIFIICLVLSQKMSDDTPLINKDFAIIYPAITAQTVNVLERSMITLLEFDLHISLQTYINYFMDVALVTKTNLQRRNEYSKQQMQWSKLISSTRQVIDDDIIKSLEMRRAGHSGGTDTRQTIVVTPQQTRGRKVRAKAFEDMMEQLQNPQPLTIDLLVKRNRELEARKAEKLAAALQAVEELQQKSTTTDTGSNTSSNATNPSTITTATVSDTASIGSGSGSSSSCGGGGGGGGGGGTIPSHHSFTSLELAYPEFIKQDYVPADTTNTNTHNSSSAITSSSSAVSSSSTPSSTSSLLEDQSQTVTVGYTPFAVLPRIVPSLDDPQYCGLSRSIYDGIPPTIGRYETSRVHWTEFYSRNRAYWKKLVMTPEGLSSAGRSQYRVLA